MNTKQRGWLHKYIACTPNSKKVYERQKKRKGQTKKKFSLDIRIELMTSRLTVGRSNQLSYRSVKSVMGIAPTPEFRRSLQQTVSYTTA